METQEMVVIYHDPDAHSGLRKDPAWFVDGYGHNLVATVKINRDEYIDIYCDGEMKANVYHKDRATDGRDTVTDWSGWQQHGITTDTELHNAIDAGKVEFDMNSWFDLYQTSVEPLAENGWLDCVNHSLDEAIEQAKTILAEAMDK
jgi:ABC-type transport system substrate-binding protein